MSAGSGGMIRRPGMTARRFGYRGRRVLALAAILTLIAGYAVASPGRAFAAVTTYTVNSFVDSPYVGPGCVAANGKCTQRAAIQAANNNDAGTGFYVINLPAGTYPLTLGQLVLNNTAANGQTTIAGAGMKTTIVQQTVAGNRVYDNEGNATIQDVTITGGNVPSDVGGGVYDDGNLGLLRVHITKNTANSGGGIYKSSSFTTCGENCEPPLVITDSTIDFNAAQFEGGAIDNDGSVTLTNSHVDHNMATDAGGQGGGLYSYDRFTADRSTFDFNVAGGTSPTNALSTDGGQGGGIWNDGVGQVTNSHAYGNTGGYDGGGVWNGYHIAMSVVSINGNQAGSEGGAVWNGYDLKMTNMVMMFNTAGGPVSDEFGRGGAVYNTDHEQMNGGLLRNNETFNYFDDASLSTKTPRQTPPPPGGRRRRRVQRWERPLHQRALPHEHLGIWRCALSQARGLGYRYGPRGGSGGGERRDE